MVSSEVAELFKAAGARGAEAQAEWTKGMEAYTLAHPAQATELLRRFAFGLPDNWKVRPSPGGRAAGVGYTHGILVWLGMYCVC